MLLTNKAPLTSEAIGQLPVLQYIGMLATGYDVVDLKVVKKRNIPICNVSDYGTKSVAQMAFAYIVTCSVINIKRDYVCPTIIMCINAIYLIKIIILKIESKIL